MALEYSPSFLSLIHISYTIKEGVDLIPGCEWTLIQGAPHIANATHPEDVYKRQIQHDERKTDSRDHNTRRKSVLTQGRSDGLTLSELEAHGQRSGLEHGLQRLRLIKRVACLLYTSRCV